MPPAQPELKKVRFGSKTWETNSSSLRQYLDKRLYIQLNGSRRIIGTLRGYDVRLPDPLTEIQRFRVLTGLQVYLNIVLDDAIEETPDGEKKRMHNAVRLILPHR